MVQHYVSPVYVYKYPFEVVMAAYIRRFPRTEHIPILADSEVVEEEKSADGFETRTVRRCKLVVEAPYIIKRIAGIDYCYFVQENVINWKEKTLRISVSNETFSSKVRVKERCLYTVHNDNKNWTCYDQEATIEFVNFFGFEAQSERLALEKYTQQIRRAKDIMDVFIQELFVSRDPVPNPHLDYLAQQASSNMAALSVSPTAQSLTDVGAEERLQQAGEEACCGAASDPAGDGTAAPCSSSSIASSNASVSGDGSASAATNTATSSVKSVGRLTHRNTKSLETAKLNAEYIQRFLGELTPIQESNLIQLRSLISASRFAGQMPNDAVLLRFLRAREFNIERARDMICHHLAWRKQYQVDQIIQTWQQPEVIRLYYPGGWHYSDKDNHPVYMLRLGQLDVKGLFESVGEAAITKQLLVFEEEGLKRCEVATKCCDKAIGTVTLVCDLEGLSMSHFWRPGINCFDRLLQLFQNNYPETMGRLLFVRAPRIFPLLWALVFPFLDECTREKVYVSAGNDYLNPDEGLSNFLPSEYIPDFLGGSCACSFSMGGMVPKKYFADSPFSVDSQKSCALETLFTTVDVHAPHAYEVLVEAASQSVIMWDFDVVRGSVNFSVLHLADNPAESTEVLTVGECRSSSSEHDSTARSRGASSDSCSSIIGMYRAGKVFPFNPTPSKREKELSMAKVVIPVQSYHETGNVQDTLAVSSHCGRYLLRWEVCDAPGAPMSTSSPPPLDMATTPDSTTPTSGDSPSLISVAAAAAASAGVGGSTSTSVFRFTQNRKATVMYYCEVIPSANVKKASASLKDSKEMTNTGA